MFDFLIGNGFLSSILAFIIVLIPAVIVHELGHFFAARAIGVTVLEFGIGLPPRVMRLFMWRETEFTLNMIPLGGFVRPFGEDVIQTVDEDSKGDEQRDALYSERQILAERGVTNPVSVYDVKALPRIFFLIAGALANFLLALVVFVIVGLTGVPEEIGATLGFLELNDDSVFAEAGFLPEDLILSVDDELYQTQAEFNLLVSSRVGQTVTFGIRRPDENGRLFNTTLEAEITPTMLDYWTQAYPFVRLSGVNEGSPGHLAGLVEGDRIVAVNGVDVTIAESPTVGMQEITADLAGTEVILTLNRDGQLVDIPVVPRVNPPAGEGAIGILIRSEIAPPDDSFVLVKIAQLDFVPQSLLESINYAFTSVLEIFQTMLELPSRFIQGALEPGEGRVISVVGVSQLGGEILQDSIQENNFTVFLRYIALISVALGITNLLPIPALDGGRIVFALIELIRGKPIAPEREGFVHMIGLILLLSLGILLIINDVMNPVTELLR